MLTLRESMAPAVRADEQRLGATPAAVRVDMLHYGRQLITVAER
jgi:hypothetical protein